MTSELSLQSRSHDSHGVTAFALLLSEAFWKHSWQKRISADAIHLYLAGEVEKQTSPYAPWWRAKRDEIAKKYGFQKQIVNRAQQELQRMGLLEILFETGQAPKGSFARHTNYFRQNPFYDRDEREKKISEIMKEFPRATATIAEKIADITGCPSDAEARRALCKAITTIGKARTTKALSTLSSLSPNSTKRTLDYALELLGESDSL